MIKKGSKIGIKPKDHNKNLIKFWENLIIKIIA